MEVERAAALEEVMVAARAAAVAVEVRVVEAVALLTYPAGV